MSDRQTTRPASDELEPGIPATSEMPRDVPPGSEDEEEIPPLDVPQAVEEWGTTAEEELLGESLASRVAREEPDFGTAARGADAGVSLLEPGSDDGLTDNEPDAIGEVDFGGDTTPSPEESAMRIEEEPEGLNYDPSPGYLDEDAGL